MADKRITELNLHTSLVLSDVIAIVNSGETKKTTYGTLYYGIRDGVVSGSSQITISDTTGFTEFSSSLSASIALGTNEQDLSNYALISGGNEFIGDQTISGSLFVSGGTELGGDIFPKTPQGARLGTPENPFREIYLQSGSITIESDTPGDPSAKISNSDGNVSITTAGFQIVNDQIGKTVFRTTRGGRVILTTRDEVYVTGSAMSIIGSDSGTEYPRNFDGTLLHLTNQEGESARMSIDSFGTGSLGEDRYPLIAGRRGRGTVDSPTAVKDDDTLFRIAVQGYGETDFVRSIGRFNISAREDFTDTVGGTKSSIWLTPIGSTTIQKVVEFNTDEVQITGSLDVSSSFTSSLTEGHFLVGNGDNKTQEFPTSSFVQTTQTGSLVQSAHISLYSTASQQLVESGSAQPVTFTSVWTQNGVSLVSGSQIVMEKAGTYQFNFVAQVQNTQNAVHDSYFWIKYNGNNFPNSSTQMSLLARKNDNTPSSQLMTVNIVGVAQNDNDYIELYWTGDSDTIRLNETPSDGVKPETPSVIANIIRVG